jgi:hypothetical protein
MMIEQASDAAAPFHLAATGAPGGHPPEYKCMHPFNSIFSLSDRDIFRSVCAYRNYFIAARSHTNKALIPIL